MKKEPLVSVIIPTYNRVHLIEETLDSVLAQTYQNWECIIVDDGSTDNTDAVVGEYVKKDSRFKYFHRPDEHLPGGNGARNYGFKMSQGEYVIFFDSDDLLSKDCLLVRTREIFKKNDDYDLLVTYTLSFQKKIGDSDILWNVLKENDTHTDIILRFLKMDVPWQTNGVTWNRFFFKSIGMWDESLRAWQDWELHIRAMFFRPNLLYNLSTIDNYFRLDADHFHIGSKFQTFEYIYSLEKIISKTSELIVKLHEDEQVYLKDEFERLTLRLLIKFSMTNYNLAYPILSLLKKNKFKIISYSRFIETYLVLLLCKSTKIKNYLFRAKFDLIYEQLNVKRTQLDVKISQIENLKNAN